jgi:hypothetical protein
VTAQTLGREFLSDGWKIGGRRQPLCVGIEWTEISSEERFSSMTRTKIHFLRTDLTIDLIIAISKSMNIFSGNSSGTNNLVN